MGVPNKIFVIAVLMVLSTTSAHALASYQQPSDLNKVTKWNRFTDYMSTVGKSDSEKKAILREKKLERRKERMLKNQNKSKKERARRRNASQ